MFDVLPPRSDLTDGSSMSAGEGGMEREGWGGVRGAEICAFFKTIDRLYSIDGVQLIMLLSGKIIQ